MAVGNEEDLALLQNPDMWVNWPIMPVKRSKTGGWPEIGVVIIVGGEAEPRVFKKGLFDFETGPLDEQLSTQDWEDSYKYDSLEAMLADGWMVD